MILALPPDQKDVTLLLNRLDTLVHDTCEIAAWTAAAGIPTLSIYERSGTRTPYPATTASSAPT